MSYKNLLPHFYNIILVYLASCLYSFAYINKQIDVWKDGWRDRYIDKMLKLYRRDKVATQSYPRIGGKTQVVVV